MRLTNQQISAIIQAVHRELGTETGISLYGSRLNDQGRGGDVDLLLEVKDHVSPLKKAALKLHLESMLGLPVDILISEAGKDTTPFIRMAKARARPLVAA